MIFKNPLRKVGGRHDVTFAEEVGQVTETQTRNLTDLFNWALQQSKVVFK